MSDQEPPKAPPNPAEERQKRLEQALRANLKRRKAGKPRDG
jgi:hypothetical protein